MIGRKGNGFLVLLTNGSRYSRAIASAAQNLMSTKRPNLPKFGRLAENKFCRTCYLLFHPFPSFLSRQILSENQRCLSIFSDGLVMFQTEQQFQLHFSKVVPARKTIIHCWQNNGANLKEVCIEVSKGNTLEQTI